MRLRFLFPLLAMLVSGATQAAVLVFKNDTYTFLPTNALFSNFANSASVVFSLGPNGVVSATATGGSATNAQPPSPNLTNWSTITTQALRVAKTVFMRTNGVDATAAREWMHLPFATLSNAVAALQSYDVLDIGPGFFYGNTAVTIPAGCEVRGAGSYNTVIQQEAVGATAITGRSTNTFTDFYFLTTNYANGGGAVVPFTCNSTNLLVRNLVVDAYYDGFVLSGGGNNSATFENVFIWSAYDAINAAAWGTNATIEMYGCKLLVDYNKGGATKPPDSRAFYAISPNLKAVGCQFIALGWSNSTAIDVTPAGDFPPIIAGSIVYSDLGEALNNIIDIVDSDFGSPTFLQATGWTHSVYSLPGTYVSGRASGPFSGSLSDMSLARFGIQEFATNAVHSFMVGVSNTLQLVTNAGIVGLGGTNMVPWTVKYVVRNDATATIQDETNTTVHGTWKYTAGSPGAGKVLTSDANGLASWGASGGAGPYILYTNGFGTNTSFFDGLTVDSDGMTNAGSYVFTNGVRLNQAGAAIIEIVPFGTADMGLTHSGGAMVQQFENAGSIRWSSTGASSGTTDLILRRQGASILEIVNASGTAFASFVLSNLTAAGSILVTNVIRNNPRTLAYSGGTNVTVDCSTGNFFNLTMTNNAKLWATNVQAGATYIVNLVQDGTGSRLLYWDSGNIATNAVHVLSTAANAKDVLYWSADHTGTNVNSVLNANFQK